MLPVGAPAPRLQGPGSLQRKPPSRTAAAPATPGLSARGEGGSLVERALRGGGGGPAGEKARNREAVKVSFPQREKYLELKFTEGKSPWGLFSLGWSARE